MISMPKHLQVSNNFDSELIVLIAIVRFTKFCTNLNKLLKALKPATTVRNDT
jgi:hypothetical protein